MKSSLEVKAADYTIGWNDGHDTLYGRPDTRRAVFAANPFTDTPYEQYAAAHKFPLFSTPNVTKRPFHAIVCLCSFVVLVRRYGRVMLYLI